MITSSWHNWKKNNNHHSSIWFVGFVNLGLFFYANFKPISNSVSNFNTDSLEIEFAAINILQLNVLWTNCRKLIAFISRVYRNNLNNSKPFNFDLARWCFWHFYALNHISFSTNTGSLLSYEAPFDFNSHSSSRYFSHGVICSWN